jgi:hypothetical protein
VKIDKTRPTLSPSVSPNPVVLNGTATATAGAADALSGILVQACNPLDTHSVGTKTAGCLATDKAGNTNVATTTYKVIYRFDGFLQPVNDTTHPLTCGSPCPTSVFKGGNSVPTKFQLKDANGNIVKAATAPIWVTPLKGTATSAAVNESIYKDAPTTGTSYKLSGNQYVFNWGTKNVAAGYNWRIGVQLDDGQVYYVTIGLR